MEGFKPSANEATPDPLEALHLAKRPKEIRQAVRGLYPKKEISDIYRSHDQAFGNNPNGKWDETMERIREEVKPELDQYVETIFEAAGDRPEAIMAAYSNVIDTGHLEADRPHVSYINDTDKAAYKELFKAKAVASLKQRISGMSEEDIDDAIYKYADFDDAQLLSSAEPSHGKWAKEVRALIEAS